MISYQYDNQPNNKDLSYLWNSIVSVPLNLINMSTGDGVLILYFNQELTTPQQTVVQNIVDSCPLLFSNRKLTKLEFRNKFTFSERVLLDNSTIPEVVVLRNDLLVSEFVDLDYPGLVSGMDLLVSLSILTSQRKSEILA